MLQSGSFTSGVYEFKNLLVVPEEIVALHASPGVCGQPSIRDILEPHYKEDWGGFPRILFMVCLRLSVVCQIKSSLQMIVVQYFELI